jgi:hypothetical protein
MSPDFWIKKEQKRNYTYWKTKPSRYIPFFFFHFAISCRYKSVNQQASTSESGTNRTFFYFSLVLVFLVHKPSTSRSNDSLLLFFSRTSYIAHSRGADKICVMGKKPGAFFFFFHIIYTRTYIYLHIPFSFYIVVALPIASSYSSVVYIVRRTKEKKVLCFSLS